MVVQEPHPDSLFVYSTKIPNKTFCNHYLIAFLFVSCFGRKEQFENVQYIYHLVTEFQKNEPHCVRQARGLHVGASSFDFLRLIDDGLPLKESTPPYSVYTKISVNQFYKYQDLLRDQFYEYQDWLRDQLET